MTRRTFFALSAALQTRRPNIILIVSDDQGWWDLGHHGNPAIETPNLDKLARESVQFNRFYVSPVCAPTRASLMTGRHYLRTGVYNTRFGGDTLDASEVTLPQLLKTAGYRTAIFGKWHLGRYAKYHPLNRGFDEALTFSQGHLERYTHPNQLNWQRQPVDARGHITDVIADSARAFIRSRTHEPFFLYTTFNAPHTPLYAPDAFAEKYIKKGLNYSNAHMYGMVEHMDAAIGRILEVVDNNAVVLFMSDNGGVSRHFTAGLRGFKASAFEGGVRSPLFVRWPGHFKAGRKVNAVAAHIDILPTLCAIAGVKAPAVDGRSFLAHLEGDAPIDPNRRVFHIWDRISPSLNSNWAIGGQRYKLVRNQLFDLESDPGETTDIAKQHPEIAASLRAEFEAWLAEVTKGKTFEPVPIEVGRPDENPVEIQASWARLSGNATYTFAGYDWDTVEGMRTPADQAQWKIDVVRPGPYEVTVSYALAADAGPARGKLGALEIDLESTAGPAVFSRKIAGRQSLGKGPQMLLLTANNPKLALNRIWLRKLEK
ncbi:MAG: arylsulfatase [Bryobacteraceae bacterium]